MYLRQLQAHSRLLSAAVILFICGQLFVILIWGIVITPFYNYGMFSEVIHQKDSYEVFEVEVNNKRLRGENFSSQQWDKVILPLQYYAGIKKSNSLYRLQIRRLLGKMQVSTNDANFIQLCNYAQFENWYKHYLQTITNQEIQSVVIYYRNYQFQSNRLQATPSFIPLSQLCR